jgi:phosphopantothenate---cysteine ligase (CTP)
MFNKAIITSGPTREWLDPVRYISNASSGKMGFHIAEEISTIIKDVIYIHGNLQEKYSKPKNCNTISIETTKDLLNEILNQISNDTLLIMAAAPVDFSPEIFSNQKIKKTNQETITLNFKQNPDILKNISDFRNSKGLKNVSLIGFSAETENLEINAINKLKKKGIDFIIGNLVGKKEGFGETPSKIFIYSYDGVVLESEYQSKEILGKTICNFIKKTYLD